MDGAMTKVPLGGEKTGPNPTDRAKLGTKRSVLTEANGIPMSVAVDGANRNDFKMARDTLERIPIDRPKPTKREPQGWCLDKGADTYVALIHVACGVIAWRAAGLLRG